MKKLKRKQVTCLCHAYSFPHRIGSGECSGSHWADSYKTNYGEYCSYCNCYSENDCDVINGAENIRECEAYKFYLHYNSPERLPKELEEDLDDEYSAYYQELEERDE